MQFGFFVVAALLVGLVWLVFNWRVAITVRRSVFIRKPPAAVWHVLAPRAGGHGWQADVESLVPLDDAGLRWRRTHRLDREGGEPYRWTIDFAVEEIDPPRRVLLRRVGLAPDERSDRLLAIEADLAPRDGGTTLTWAERWGPRSLSGCFIAHAEAATALARLKELCETGRVPEGGGRWQGQMLSALSGVATLAAFALLLGWKLAAIFALILLVHEFGHLLSLRLVGQPWGRIVFVPFVGGVAVSRLPHVRAADDVFCALMGAGLSLVLLVPAVIASQLGLGDAQAHFIYATAAVTGAINLLNLLPLFPLDGGRVVRAMLQSGARDMVKPIMFGIAGVMGVIAIAAHSPVLAAMAFVAFLQGRHFGPLPEGVARLDARGALALGFTYIVLIAAHAAAVASYWRYLAG